MSIIKIAKEAENLYKEEYKRWMWIIFQLRNRVKNFRVHTFWNYFTNENQVLQIGKNKSNISLHNKNGKNQKFWTLINVSSKTIKKNGLKYLF